MNVTDPITLSTDVLVTAVRDLPPQVREEIGDDTAFALTRSRGRSPSILVDQASAELVGEFRRPSTIVDAVIRFGRRVELDPEPLLSEMYPTIRRLLAAGYLVPAGSERAAPQRTVFTRGERVAGGAVVRCVRVLEETELYQLALDCGGFAALKVEKPGRSPFAEGALARDAEMLAVLDGRVSPRLFGTGETAGNPWLSMEWCEGIQLAPAGAGLRRAGSDAGLLDLARRVAHAYSVLHDSGVVHGDVHPGNVLVPGSDAVRLVDFGLARRADDDGSGRPPPRGGVQAFCDPQYASAQLRQQPPPPASFHSDQFSLGAALYQAFTGSNYVDFSLDKEEQLRQVAEAAPLPFTRRGRAPWPAVERVLRRALAKDPGDRFASCSELSQRLAAGRTTRVLGATGDRGIAALDGVLHRVVTKASPGGEWFERGVPAAPFCSVAYGAAGVAAALYRVGALRSDAELAALADEWTVRARRDAGREGAFTSDELPLREERTGLVSPFHRISGVHAVQALVSHAVGDARARQEALRAFVAASDQPCDNLDLTLGRSGTVLASALLLEAVGDAPYVDTDDLVALGRRTLAGVWQELDALPPPGESRVAVNLGMAHGWAGFLYATLRWCRAAREPLPVGLVDRLDQLGALAHLDGLAARWSWNHDPTSPSPGPTMPGWCNGSAGYVHLWATAHAVLGHEAWAALAEKAAWDVYTSPNRIAQLCCGLAGQAYALLEMYAHSGEGRWLTAARELAAHAAADTRGSGTLVAGSLHKGDVGIAVLAADLANPDAAAMPFFGQEYGRRP